MTARTLLPRASNRRWIKLAALAVALLCSAVIAVPANGAPASAESAVAHLSAQRVANGMPALAFSPSMSDGCAKHLNYLEVNGIGLSHDEDPTLPGYTPEGARQTPGSGEGEVLAGDLPWDDAWSSPWRNAPLHLMLMFDPGAQASGYAAAGPRTCMRFEYGGGPAGISTLPGDGATNVPLGQDARGERPYSPADLVGEDSLTGFNLLIWRTGGPANIASASLVGPSGPVAVRVVDSRTPVPGGGTWPWGGAVLVPPAPLAPDADHQADITFTDGVTSSVRFRTASREVRSASVTFDQQDPFGGTGTYLTYETDSPAPGTLDVVRLPGGERVSTRVVSGRGSGGASFYESPGTYRACLDQPATELVAAVHVCVDHEIPPGQGRPTIPGPGPSGLPPWAGGDMPVASSRTPTPAGNVRPPGTGTRAACRPPRLKGRTLAQARRLLTRAHCRLGKVIRPRRRTRGTLVVTSQRGTTTIAVTLGRRDRVRGR